MEADLARCQSLADELAFDSLFGDSLLECVCHLKQLCDVCVRQEAAMCAALRDFATRSEQTFQLCHTTYCTLYLKMYNAMGQGGGTAEATKLSAVPIDPNSALNLVQWNADEMRITLYNDNETLFKFAPSELAAKEGIATLVDDMEAYYDAQCDAIEDFYEAYTALVTRADHLKLDVLRVAQQTVQVKDVLTQLPSDAKTLALAVALAQLRASAESASEARHQEAANCRQMVANASAKFNCCARLKDAMLRPYHLSQAHRCTGLVSPLF